MKRSPMPARRTPLRTDPTRAREWQRRSAARWHRSRARTGAAAVAYREAGETVYARSGGDAVTPPDPVHLRALADRVAAKGTPSALLRRQVAAELRACARWIEAQGQAR